MAQVTDSGNSAVYTGFWNDHGNAAYLTLENRKANALISFLAIAVTFAGNRSWKIVRFALYHVLCRRDGDTLPSGSVKRQLQVILRNVVTAGSTLVTLGELLWDNRQKAKKRNNYQHPSEAGKVPKRKTGRTTSLILIATVHYVAYIAAGILTSYIVVGRLVVSSTIPSCGQWTGRDTSELASLLTWQSLRLNETQDADNYVRNCYPLGVSRGILDCDKLVTRSLPYHLEHNVQCPFGSELCSERPNGAVVLDSGAISFQNLGINTKFARTLSVQRRSVCAVVPDTPFLDQRILGKDGVERRSYTFYLPTDPNEARGAWYRNSNSSGTYDLQSYHLIFSPANIVESLRPTTNDHDPSVIYLRSNGVQFLTEHEDPWFSVHTQTRFDNSSGDIPPGFVRWETDRFLNIIACKEAIRFCGHSTSPENCTPYTGLNTALKSVTNATATLSNLLGVRNGSKDYDELSRLYSLVALSADMTSIPGSIQHRQAPSALQAARYLETIVQFHLEPEQWKVELEYWFAMALARLQLAVFNTIEKPPSVNESQAINLWGRAGLQQLCGRVKYHSPNHTTLSTVGFGVTLGLVGLLTLLSFMDVYLGWLSMPWAKRMTARWNELDNLSLLEELEKWEGDVRRNVDPLMIAVETK
ncbi:hypothetical protein FB567DRAFT_550023 [Paraphoma chrysanthemicola]|uniref:Uncharacterized protein n=1 Tax=Paraphoma chrysanthemicola TaxID=798071 RepID=A0A8K0R4R8_9PLEO|nr:hypothetical protein FB567DRAFT_550023 [Paraphoma chrysanthemicola]